MMSERNHVGPFKTAMKSWMAPSIAAKSNGLWFDSKILNIPIANLRG